MESHVRNAEDAILLDTIVDTQQLLQVDTTLLSTHLINLFFTHLLKLLHPESLITMSILAHKRIHEHAPCEYTLTHHSLTCLGC